MGKNVFSVPIFFIVFRETLEAAIIVSVLCGLVEQIAYDHNGLHRAPDSPDDKDSAEDLAAPPVLVSPEDAALRKRRFLRRMRWQIFAGSFVGLFIALAIGAAFIAVWFTKASNLWAKSEELWEGIFELIACIMIFVMGVTMLKMDRAKAKWRVKLQRAFDGQHVDGKAKSGKWVLFVLPMITVLREGMEAVIFVGGVSLGQPATSIPLAAVVGLICGLICGYIIYTFASRTTLTVFLVVMTNFILLIGAGLFSRAVWAFQEQRFNHLLGADVDDAGGDGPGSFDVRGNVWHLDCCNPDDNFDNSGWSLFNAIFGWTNSATLGSVLGYVFYWLAAIVTLVAMKWKEGRTKVLGRESAAGVRRRERAALARGDAEMAATDEKASA
ncbi:iron permease FTR1 [Phlebiopsis gigantea 11061_1 CR5-6]|uniref:Iron permease FTR1 n=1 Tax=Phlebiopsis gigantea (strain 11061_1 CR5-6) TaxID=745531 RepID=A0A0C3RSK8_PHLG1|nr:iron permease FTR1 [Phlebiopsis gigantea 11061_1 CR5-6]